MNYEAQVNEILDSAVIQLSTIKPSQWAESSIIMQKPFPGPFRYSKTPYTREIVDCLAPDNPAKVIAVKKGAQIGFSAGVIYPGLGWIIKNNPGNTLLMLGSPDLIEKSMEKIDLMIDSAGLRHLIKPSSQRNRANKSGDTNFKKEFPLGYISLASANNHKAIRQMDVQFIFIDDYAAIKRASKESGSTRKLIEQRAAAYGDRAKIFFISTPEEEQDSNIEEVYLLGDQRRYRVPCPCCGSAIVLDWNIRIDERESAGITWKTDTRGRLITSSVGYICQDCSGFFTDSKKDVLLNEGFWKATAEAAREGNLSYQVSSLYAPPGMYDWVHYVANYMEACPEGAPRKEDLFKAHQNLCLGLCYAATGKAPKANQLQKNIYNYSVGDFPEKLSISQGNGNIMLLTLSCDLNGKEDDARLDWEVVGWSENGCAYSMEHGSIGTFVPREGDSEKKEDRVHWTYKEETGSISVWPELTKIVERIYETGTGRRMGHGIVGIDSGHFTQYVYNYVEYLRGRGHNAVALKGKDRDKFVKKEADMKSFVYGKEKPYLYLVNVNHVKDILARLMELKYNKANDVSQPTGFMNYPIPSGGKYLFENFFKHYESEHKIIQKDNGDGLGSESRWEKVTTIAQNHFWDIRVYGLTLVDIFVAEFGNAMGIKNCEWVDYVSALLGKVRRN